MRSLRALAAAAALTIAVAGVTSGQGSDGPITTDELLAGMTTEVVEPGVLRVVHDGARDLTRSKARILNTGRDGSVWLQQYRKVRRLGAEEALPGRHSGPFAVGPDGVLWIVEPRTDKRGRATSQLRSFDGEAWETHKVVGHSAKLSLFDVATDGTVWTAWHAPELRWDQRSTVVASLADDGWRLLERPLKGSVWALDVTDSGEVWASGSEGLVRYLDGEWRPPAGGSHDVPGGYFIEVSDVGRDGTAWLLRTEHSVSSDPHAVVRFDGSVTEAWGLSDTASFAYGAFKVAPDGHLWMRGTGPDGSDGLIRFDGTSWERFLEGRLVYDWDFAEDGALWSVTRSPAGGASEVLVIPPGNFEPAE